MTHEPAQPLTGSAASVRRAVAARLREAGVPSPDADASWLVAEVVGTTPAALVMSGELDERQAGRLGVLVARRAAREPLQHILGSAAFRNLVVAVGPGVFVPRPETEVLVDLALAALAGGDAPSAVPAGGDVAGGATDAAPGGGGANPTSARVVDLCSGSGVIALAVATERPRTSVWAVERDADAGRWLKRNVAAHEQVLADVGSNVEVVPGDATTPPSEVPRGVDVVTCNPPYIPDAAVPRDLEVAQYDPAAALYGGLDGLDVVRGVVSAATVLLRPGGALLIEHGDEQGGADGVPGVIASHGGFVDIADHRDHAGRPRVTLARRA